MMFLTINKKAKKLAFYISLSLLFLGILLLAGRVVKNDQRIKELEKQNSNLSDKLKNSNTTAENPTKAEKQYSSCNETNYCNQVVENLNTLIGTYTSRFLELTFKVSLPQDWIFSSWGGNEYGFSIGTRSEPVIANVGPYKGEYERVECVQNPELQQGISNQEKKLFEKYKSFKTSFGNMKLSRKANYKGYSYTEPTYVICQEVYEGYPVFVTDTSIGIINIPVYPDKTEEVEKLISILKNIKITKKVLKL